MAEMHVSGAVSVSPNLVGTVSESKKAMAQKKTIYPTFEDGVYKPDANYDYISEVEVKAIPVRKVPNEAGGITLIIGRREEDDE